MKLLLDTNVAFWAVSDHSKLSDRNRSIITDPANDVYVSVVTIWEIAIKHPLQRGSMNDMPITGREARALFEDAGFTILPVTAEHAAAVDDLAPNHRDPFDRMLVAQATCESMRLLSADKKLAAYGAMVLLV